MLDLKLLSGSLDTLITVPGTVNILMAGSSSGGRGAGAVIRDVWQVQMDGMGSLQRHGYSAQHWFLDTVRCTARLNSCYLDHLLARAECVRCPWALLRNEVSTINGVFFSLFSLLTLLFSQKSYRRVPKFCIGFQLTPKNKIWGERKVAPPPCPRGGVDFLGLFSEKNPKVLRIA
jgi:hypothetical protein